MPFTKTQHRLSSRDRMSTIHRRNILVLKIILALILFLLFISFVSATLQIGTLSMEPSLPLKSRILYHPLNMNKHITRGDVVLLEPPFYKSEGLAVGMVNRVVGFFTFQKLQLSFYPREGWINRYTVKRVVAMPGDTIKMEDWVLYIKTAENPYYLSEFECTEKEYDIRVEDSPVELKEGDPLSGYLPEMTLNRGEYFLLGDNRRYSNDSYYWGVLNEDRIRGKLLFVYWPLKNFGFVR
ncbi:MAG: signal peptidase I [Spirochaetales bacterium]|nr:signal peptidase I [Spirochaetales bacterium]